MKIRSIFSFVLASFWLHFGCLFGSILAPFWCSGRVSLLVPLYFDFESRFGCSRRLQKSSKKPLEISSNFGWIFVPILGRISVASGLRFELQKCIKIVMKEPSFSCTGSMNSSLQAGPSRSLSEMAPKLHRFSEPKSVPKWLPKGSQKEAQNHPENE